MEPKAQNRICFSVQTVLKCSKCVNAFLRRNRPITGGILSRFNMQTSGMSSSFRMILKKKNGFKHGHCHTVYPEHLGTSAIDQLQPSAKFCVLLLPLCSTASIRATITELCLAQPPAGIHKHHPTPSAAFRLSAIPEEEDFRSTLVDRASRWLRKEVKRSPQYSDSLPRSPQRVKRQPARWLLLVRKSNAM